MHHEARQVAMLDFKFYDCSKHVMIVADHKTCFTNFWVAAL